MAIVLAPGDGQALVVASISNGGGSLTEGDPIDSNDYDGSSSGGGGGGTDVHDSLGSVAPVRPVVPNIIVDGRWSVMIVVDYQLGLPSFSIIVIDSQILAGEGRNAQ